MLVLQLLVGLLLGVNWLVLVEDVLASVLQVLLLVVIVDVVLLLVEGDLAEQERVDLEGVEGVKALHHLLLHVLNKVHVPTPLLELLQDEVLILLVLLGQLEGVYQIHVLITSIFLQYLLNHVRLVVGVLEIVLHVLMDQRGVGVGGIGMGLVWVRLLGVVQ